MENDEIQYIIKNSTFIKNNLLNKVDDNLNLLMIIFVILNEEDKNKKKKNLLLLENYINENTKINIENNDKDFLTIISTINLFIRKAYNDDSKAKKMFEHINEYLMYLNLNEKKIQFTYILKRLIFQCFFCIHPYFLL